MSSHDSNDIFEQVMKLSQIKMIFLGK